MTDLGDDLHLTATDLRQATLRLSRRLRRERAVNTLSFPQLAVLGTLRVHGRLTITALAEHEQVTAPSMTNLVNALEELDYAVRIPDEEDRRRVQVEITPTGTEIVEETTRRRDAVLADALEELGFGKKELATLRTASELMRRIAAR